MRHAIWRAFVTVQLRFDECRPAMDTTSLLCLAIAPSIQDRPHHSCGQWTSPPERAHSSVGASQLRRRHQMQYCALLTYVQPSRAAARRRSRPPMQASLDRPTFLADGAGTRESLVDGLDMGVASAVTGLLFLQPVWSFSEAASCGQGACASHTTALVPTSPGPIANRAPTSFRTWLTHSWTLLSAAVRRSWKNPPIYSLSAPSPSSVSLA